MSGDVSKVNELIFLFNARDERDPHGFMKDDPLWREGAIESWDIKEIDFVSKDRDNELVISGQYK